MRTPATVALISIALHLGTARAEVKKGDKYVELDATTAKGGKFRLKDLAGTWVLFTFNASWCAPCHKELVAWDRLAPKFSGTVTFVAVNINSELAEGKQFIETLKLKHLLPVFLPGENSPALKAYDPDKMPSTFVIDPQGVVRFVAYGYHPGDEDALARSLGELTKK